VTFDVQPDLLAADRVEPLGAVTGAALLARAVLAGVAIYAIIVWL
jgi:hypothetical protein